MKIKLGLIVSVVALMFTSCSNDVEDRLPGTWNAVVVQTLSVQSYTTTLTGSMTFNEDGTGTSTFENDPDSDSFTWTLDDDGNLSMEDGDWGINDNMKLSNDTNEEEKQVFSGSTSIPNVPADWLLTLTK